MEKRSGFLLSLGLSGACLLALAGCTAAVGGQPQPGATASSSGAGASSNGSGGTSSSAGGQTSVPGGGDAAVCDANASLAPARIWRLTDAEYVNVVQAVFGVTMPAEISEAEVNTGDYTNLSEGTNVSDPIALNYQTAAHEAAQQAVTSHLSTFLSCGAWFSDASSNSSATARCSRVRASAQRRRSLEVCSPSTRPAMTAQAVGIRPVTKAALQSGSRGTAMLGALDGRWPNREDNVDPVRASLCGIVLSS